MKVMNRFHIRFVLFFLIVATCIRCSDEQLVLRDETYTVDPSDAVVQQILKLGIELEDIKAHKDFYVAQGDILFPRKSATSSTPKTEQRRWFSIISPSNVRDIKIYLDEESFAILDLMVPLNLAISAFNASGSNLRMRRVFSLSHADITIRQDNSIMDLNYCGTGRFPFAGRPGSEIKIAEGFSILTSPSRLTFLLAHELGHTVGLRHTNETNGSQIIGTPAFDPLSVMNGSTCGNFWQGLSIHDKSALRKLYPAAAPNRLLSGNQLVPGQFLKSPNGQYRLILQHDGNLVYYHHSTAIWHSGTHGQPIAKCVMQANGDLVLLNSSGQVKWSSGTNGQVGSWLNVQDGRVVIYSTFGGAIWWRGL